MNILVDNHHGALLRSMYYLFKKRFGFNVYVPHGMEWLDMGRLYSCYPNRATSEQMLNGWKNSNRPEYNMMFNSITFDEFLNSDINIIVASLHENHQVFLDIIHKYDKKSKLILQVGNNIPLCVIKNVNNLLSSSYPVYVESSVPNKVFYHQEFGLEYYHPKIPTNTKSIANFKHCMEEDKPLFNELKMLLPDWEFKSFGHNNDDGNLDDFEYIISNKMKEFGFIFHVKKDEGYGHIIHSAFACGKPTIVDVKKSVARVGTNDAEFIDNTASFLFDDDTIIDSNDGAYIVAEKIKNMEKDYKYYSDKVYSKFKQVVNFNKEELEIKTFLKNLI